MVTSKGSEKLRPAQLPFYIAVKQQHYLSNRTGKQFHPKTPRGPHAVSRADPSVPGLFHLE